MPSLNKIIYIPRLYKQFIMLFNDIAISFFSTFLAFSLRLDKIFFPEGMDWIIFVLSATLFIPFFIPFGLYQAIFRYSGIKSLLNIFYAITFYGIIFFSILMIAKIHGIPRSVGILQPILFFVLIASSRVFIVSIVQKILQPSLRKNALIYGAGEAGVEASTQLSDYNIIAFVDDNKSEWGKKINTIPIIKPKNIKEYILKKNITNILIAIPSLKILRRRELVSEMEKYSVAVKILPRINDLASGKFNIADFKKVEISDLLDRKISWNEDSIEKEISNKTILITGAGGSIGSELCRQIIYKNPSKIILLDHSEYNLYEIKNELEVIVSNNNLSGSLIPILCSVRDKYRIEYIITKYVPQIIYHAAAYKHVPMMEGNVLEAISNNVFGTLNIIQAISKINYEKFILISTDKAVRPTNIMGASKRFAEICIQSFYAKFSNKKGIMSIVRFGNVLGSSGSVIPLFNNQIEKGGPITVTDQNVTRYFMTISEAVGLVLQAGVISNGGEVFVLDMGDPVKIKDLAIKMIRLSGQTERNQDNPNGDIEILYTGLRSGEKMYEELLIGEDSTKTQHPDIMMEKEEFIEWSKLENIIEDLKVGVKLNNHDQILTILKKIISGFKHN